MKRLPMKLAKQSTFGNTAIVGNITYRLALTYLVTFGLGALLWFTPVFKYNWIATFAYLAFASIVIGQTPTQRSVLANLYGIVFKKPINMVVSNQATVNTLGHGIREVSKIPDIDAMTFRLGNGNVALVYNVTSGLNQWSSEEDFASQARGVKSLFNVLEGGEGLMIITKEDSDTGMLRLEAQLNDVENFDGGDDLEALSAKRKRLLRATATQAVGRSIQQYAVLLVRPKNVNRTTSALKRASRTIRAATYPGDVLLAAMGLEGGVDLAYGEKEK